MSRVSSDIEKNIIDGDIVDTKSGLMGYSEKNPLKKIYIKRWGDILDKNSYAMNMLKQSLEIDLSSNTGADYVKNKYSEILNI